MRAYFRRAISSAVFIAVGVVAFVYWTDQHSPQRDAKKGAPSIRTQIERPRGKATSGSGQSSDKDVSRVRILVIHKRPPDMSTGCDRRLMGLIGDLNNAGAKVTYLTMPVSGGSFSHVNPGDATDCVSEGERAWPKSYPPMDTMIQYEMAEQRRPPMSDGVRWLEIDPPGRDHTHGPWAEHFCQRLARLVRGTNVLDEFDAIVMPVWFWPHGGPGGSDHHSLAHQVLPAIRALVKSIPGVENGVPHPMLISVSDDAFSVRYSMLSLTESGVHERARLENSSLVVAKKEADIYASVDVAAFISAEDRKLSFPSWTVETSEHDSPPLVLLRPSSSIERKSESVQGLQHVAAAARRILLGRFHSRFGLVFLGSGAVETNYQVGR